MQAIAAKDEQYKQVKNLLDWIIALFGAFVLYFTAKKAFNSYSDIGMIDTLVSFSIPILFSALYVPVAYILAVYARYQILFIRLKYKLPMNKKVRLKRNLQIISKCQLSYKRVRRFEKEYTNRCYSRMSEGDFDLLISEFSKDKWL